MRLAYPVSVLLLYASPLYAAAAVGGGAAVVAPKTPDSRSSSSSAGKNGGPDDDGSGGIPEDSSGDSMGVSDIEEIGELLQGIVDALSLKPTQTTTDSTETFNIITTTLSIPTAAYACVTANSVYSSCSANNANFVTAAPSVQANCLCYSAVNSLSVWLPFMGECYGYARTAIQNATVMSGIALASGMCVSAREARATVTGAGNVGSEDSARTTTLITEAPFPGVASQSMRGGTLWVILGISWGWTVIRELGLLRGS